MAIRRYVKSEERRRADSDAANDIAYEDGAVMFKHGAKKVNTKKQGELPGLASPMTRLDLPLRKPVAEYCRDQGASFSSITAQMWVDLLKKRKLIKADYELPPLRKPGGLSLAGEKSYKSQIVKLRAKLEEIKADTV